MKLILNGSPDEITDFLSKVLIADDEEEQGDTPDTPTIGFNAED